MTRAYCSEGAHFPAELWADGGCELPLVQDNAGQSLGRYADGVIGPTAAEVAEAAQDDSAVCAEHRCEVEWRHNARAESVCDVCDHGRHLHGPAGCSACGCSAFRKPGEL